MSILSARKLIKKARRVRRLSRVLATLDAFKLARRETKAGEVTVRFKHLNRDAVMRTGSSDIACFDKVFLDREYADPFESRPKTVVDAGANIGMATLFFRQQYPDAEIIAVEPELSNFTILQKNCGELPHVKLIRAAIWPVKTDLAISDPGAEKWAFSVRGCSEDFGAGEKVPSITIPEILEKFSTPRINLLKLDVEGAEKELFNTESADWLRSVDMIMIELHDRYLSGCSKQFYSALRHFDFHQEQRGENLFIKLNHKPS